MTRAPTLDYSASQLPSSRYEWEMESERLRWLRRRFNWFCLVSAAITLALLPTAVLRYFRVDGWSQAAVAVNIVNGLLLCSLLAGAWWYARRRLDENTINRAATLLVVTVGLLTMVASRVDLDLQLRGVADEVLMRAGADPAEPRPVTRPVDEERADAARATAARLTTSRAARVTISVFSLFRAVFLIHFVACLFLPWRVREAVRPAAILLVAAAVLIVGDVLLLQTSLWSLPVAATALPLSVLPGVGWCWWRYSRYRKKYRLVLEGRELRELRQELDAAKSIHESSLPPIYPAGPLRLSYVYEPMRQVGGDLIFVHPRPPKRPLSYDQPRGKPPPPRYTMVLLDVTGHGVAAALTVNRLVGELERLFAEKPQSTPADVIVALNRYIYLTLATHGVFVTGLAIGVDPGRGGDLAAAFREPHAVGFCSAGHPTAFVRRVTTGRVEPLASTAMMLGVLPPAEFEAEQLDLRLEPGDAVLTYTDGAAEAREPEHRTMLGIDGVRKVLEEVAAQTPDPIAWPEAMIRRIGRFRNAPPEDDTLIAVVYRPPVPAEALEEQVPAAPVLVTR